MGEPSDEATVFGTRAGTPFPKNTPECSIKHSIGRLRSNQRAFARAFLGRFAEPALLCALRSPPRERELPDGRLGEIVEAGDIGEVVRVA
ncbi:MAG TPA: hypothetical protein P5201_10560, partial [Aminobacteriaceae bacterium]|nr:hypothetical protein [Aminobacteriaceae bacterium]